MGSAQSSDQPLSHDCYKLYELVSKGKVNFFCEGCKMPGIGPRYVCRLCDQTLHKWCRFPKIGVCVTHEHCELSEFVFRKIPSTMENREGFVTTGYKTCVACQDYIRGFSYYCEVENLSLHPGCYKLERNVYFEGKIFNLCKNMSSVCEGCESHDKNGWCYVSSCHKSQFHVHCLTERQRGFYMEKAGFAEVDLDSEFKLKMDSGNGLTNEQLCIHYLTGEGDDQKGQEKDTIADKSKQAKVSVFGKISNFFKTACHKVVSGVKITRDYLRGLAKTFCLEMTDGLGDEIENFFGKIKALLNWLSPMVKSDKTGTINHFLTPKMVQEAAEVFNLIIMREHAAALIRWLCIMIDLLHHKGPGS